ncbi:type IVB secretion system protein DotG/IcmE [Legionella oakridgensis]|uniref:type IVB secretion system protein DotG/IcmE n=1 Tax=Legionella oakridgensis TaxID=29423 RepID=UPI0003DE0E84|nr:type IVB secretion system protein DotG/IcmE [Legionella oakridgensis]ETO92534.1 low-complexity protein [Legionella oakridgensis RV-2-2007]
MAGKKENLKALFTNTRSRVIIIFTAVLLIIAVLIGVIRFSASTSRTGLTAGAQVGTAPVGIQSIPGSMDPTAQYAALQAQQNVEQAKQAAEEGGSAIPTIIRTQAFGGDIQSVGPQHGEGGVGFSTLALEGSMGPQKNQWIQSLKDANCSSTAVQQALQQGATLNDLKEACTCLQLKDNGYKLTQLQQVCSCTQLKASGFNARQLKEAGYTAGQLRICGFDACELRNAGFTAQEMKDGGFSDGELKGAGFSEKEIAQAGGLPDGITAADVTRAGCDPDALRKLREAGVSAGAIRRISGCSAAQLKAAGYTAQELKNAGFSAADLKNAGFTPDELRRAGFSARDLLNAGYSPAQLAAAGYTPSEISQAENQLPPGMTDQDVKEAGCNVEALKRERLAGVSAKLIRQDAGCSAAALKAAGFTDNDLANAGFTPAQIAAAQGVNDAAIRAAGCDPTKLSALRAQGVTATQIHELNGCSAAALKAAGFDAKDLANAGFTPQQLLDAGFTPQQLTAAGLNPAGVIAAGRTADCSVASLKAAHAMGVSASTIKDTLGCSAAALKAAGYTAAELKNAGFTAAELKNAGFTAAELKNAGFSAKELRDAGFTAQQLKDAGFSASQLKNAGFSAADLKNAGFTAAQLKAAGYSAKDLKDAGFSAADLRQAGYSAKEMKDAGFTAAQLKNAGFSNQQLQDAGFSPQESAVAGLGEAPEIPGGPSAVAAIPGIAGPTLASQADSDASAKQLQDILKRQQTQMADQRYQQKLQARTNVMLSTATQSIQDWRKVGQQVYIEGKEKSGAAQEKANVAVPGSQPGAQPAGGPAGTSGQKALIKTGEVMFAVLDTSVNSDEPSPILATIVSGKFKGTKLIGSFNLPSNADKMVISFNTMSVPGAAKTTSISAYAIDPNTARTALASYTNHHYLLRYGSLFASSFLEGFGNAFQSANTTITIGGTAGAQTTTVQSGIGRSIMENAVIGLATLGKNWGQEAQQLFNTPTTVEVCAGTGIGILFTQDVTSL